MSISREPLASGVHCNEASIQIAAVDEIARIFKQLLVALLQNRYPPQFLADQSRLMSNTPAEQRDPKDCGDAHLFSQRNGRPRF